MKAPAIKGISNRGCELHSDEGITFFETKDYGPGTFMSRAELEPHDQHKLGDCGSTGVEVTAGDTRGARARMGRGQRGDAPGDLGEGGGGSGYEGGARARQGAAGIRRARRRPMLILPQVRRGGLLERGVRAAAPALIHKVRQAAAAAPGGQRELPLPRRGWARQASCRACALHVATSAVHNCAARSSHTRSMAVGMPGRRQRTSR